MIWYSLHMLSEAPLIGATYSGVSLEPAARRMAQLADGAACYLFVRPSWYGPELLDLIKAVVLKIGQTAPNLHFTILNNTEDDDALFRAAGLDSLFCNHNAFIDERIFLPDIDAEQTYDAVYNGRLSPMKRHELSVLVPRLALITYGHEVEDGYARQCIAAQKDLRFVNYEPGVGAQWMEPDAVREVVNQSGCGLVLSEVEGPNYASVEYMLSGLPVVTTPSQGGRHVFFHPDYVALVDPTPEAVRDGVADILARRLDPMVIRKRTLELFMPHRARLIMRLSGIMQQNLFSMAGETLWLPSFVNKLERWTEEKT